MTIPKLVFDKFSYHHLKSVTSDSGERYYVSPDNEKLFSVTTILSVTKDMSGLDEWRRRVGAREADRICKEATNLGTIVHQHLEDYVCGRPRPQGSNLIYKMAEMMSNKIISGAMNKIDELWTLESNLYYPGLYAGTADLIGIYDGKPAIMDYKTTRKMKKKKFIDDYFVQCSAYALAHNYLYDTNISTAAIFMVDRDLNYKTFSVSDDEFMAYQEMWLTRLDKYVSDQ